MAPARAPRSRTDALGGLRSTPRSQLRGADRSPRPGRRGPIRPRVVCRSDRHCRGSRPSRRILAGDGPLADDHRAVPDPRGRAHPTDHRGRARAGPRGRRLEPVRAPRGGRPHRPPDRLGHRGDEPRPVGRDPARRRELRRQPELVRLPRGGPGAVPVPPRHPDPPGPRRGEDPVLGRRRPGQGRAQQHPLRHDPRQRRVHAARRRSTSRSPRPAGPTRSTRSRATSTSRRSSASSPSAPTTCRW